MFKGKIPSKLIEMHRQHPYRTISRSILSWVAQFDREKLAKHLQVNRSPSLETQVAIVTQNISIWSLCRILRVTEIRLIKKLFQELRLHLRRSWNRNKLKLWKLVHRIVQFKMEISTKGRKHLSKIHLIKEEIQIWRSTLIPKVPLKSARAMQSAHILQRINKRDRLPRGMKSALWLPLAKFRTLCR